MNIDLMVDWHASGNRTLKWRAAGATGMWTDVQEPHLLAQEDAALFYRAVVRYIGGTLAIGDEVASVKDTNF